MLCCIGDIVEDIVVTRPTRIAPRADTDVAITRRRGGSAANTAVAAAAIGLPVRFIGRVGDDPIGAALVHELRDAGVEACVQVGGRTGTIIVLVEPDGDRTMLRDRGAAAELDELVAPGLVDVTWLHVSAYSLVAGRVAAVAEDALVAARERGVPTSIDLSSVTVLEERRSEPVTAMIERLGTHVVFANADEYAALGEQTFDHPLLVVKRGAGPATVHDAGGDVVATADAETLGTVGDTTGAGDAFAAGFIAARLRGADHAACLEGGHRSAAAWIANRDTGRRRVP